MVVVRSNNSHGIVIVKNSKFRVNFALGTPFHKYGVPFHLFGSGGAIKNSGHLEIFNSVFEGNGSVSGGGAIENSGSLTIDGNSVFKNNWVALLNGGAIKNDT